MSRDGNGTVARAVDVLRVVAEADGDVAIKDVAKSLDLPPSTVHRLFDLLGRQGMIEPVPERRRYRTGVEFARLGALVADRNKIDSRIKAEIDAASHEADETCLLGRHIPGTAEMAFVAQAVADHPLQYRIDLNRRLPIAWGASGLAILAFLEEPQIDAIAAGRHGDISPPIAPKTLRERLADIRSAGYALSYGEKFAGAVGIAAPVVNANGIATGSFCITVPEPRFDPSREAEISTIVLRHASRVSALFADGGRSLERADAS